MIFSSFSFIFIFLPFVWGGYFCLNKINKRKLAKYFLVASSFVFYAAGSGGFVLIFMLSVAINYAIGSALSFLNKKHADNVDSVENKRMRRSRELQIFLLILGILLNVFLLSYYKYTDWFIKNFNLIFKTNFPLPHIALPIGISFFTFQLIAYLVDSYRGLTLNYKFVDYLLFITFFPQLIVGPIVHHAEMVPQFEDTKNLAVNWENVAKGLFVFSIGMAKKILLADPLTANAQSFFEEPAQIVSALCAWYYSIEYTISYYFDLSAYADMAIGVGLLFNIVIPENFDSPYKARNFKDYWQRWHITLSRFLGAYIFRSVYKKESKWRNYYFATMITFLVSGFWHGAGWHFIFWGLVNGALVCVASWMKRKGYSMNAVAAHSLTLIGIVLARIMFVCGFKQMLLVFKSLVNFSSMDIALGHGITYIKIIQLIVSCVIIFAFPTTKRLADNIRFNKKSFAALAAASALSIAFMGRTSVFLYFQF